MFEPTTNSPIQYVLPSLQCWPISAKLIVRSNYCDGSSPIDGRCWFIFAQDRVMNIYVSLRLRVQNAVPAQPCVGKLGISLVLLNFLHCNFRLWFKTP